MRGEFPNETRVVEETFAVDVVDGFNSRLVPDLIVIADAQDGIQTSAVFFDRQVVELPNALSDPVMVLTLDPSAG